MSANAGEKKREDFQGGSDASARTREAHACTLALAALAAKRTAAGQRCSAGRFHLQRKLHHLLFVELGARVLQLRVRVQQLGTHVE
jgi:hypothetical protein